MNPLTPIPPLGQWLIVATIAVVVLSLLALWEVYSAPNDPYGD